MTVSRDNTPENPASAIKAYPVSVICSGEVNQNDSGDWVNVWSPEADSTPAKTLAATFVRGSDGSVYVSSTTRLTVVCLANDSGCNVRVVGQRHPDDPGLDELVASVALVAGARTVIADGFDCSAFTNVSVQMRNGDAANTLETYIYSS